MPHVQYLLPISQVNVWEEELVLQELLGEHDTTLLHGQNAHYINFRTVTNAI